MTLHQDTKLCLKGNKMAVLFLPGMNWSTQMPGKQGKEGGGTYQGKATQLVSSSASKVLSLIAVIFEGQETNGWEPVSVSLSCPLQVPVAQHPCHLT